MIGRAIAWSAALLLALPAMAQPSPGADHHQHAFSPAIVALVGGNLKEITVRDVVGHLDDAGIRRAALLSVAYLYSSPSRNVADEYAKVRAENDWTAAQAALYPQRLRAFCAVNPLKGHALEEIARCAAHPGLSHGLKLHFGNSDVQLENAAHVEQLQRVFRAANERRMAIAVHLRASISRKRPYGAAQARAFIEAVLPAAPDIPIQVAHFAGSGPGYDDPPAHAVMEVLAEAVERRDPRVRGLLFDVASIADAALSPENAAAMARRIRQVGVERVLFGSDAASGSNLRPREAWAAFRRLPLTEEEFARIAGNIAPYLALPTAAKGSKDGG